MKKASRNGMRREYSREMLGPGVRGKFYKEYLKGTNLVLLSPDVASVFPDEDSVNRALRSLIALARRSAESPKQIARRVKARG
ncbi:MAG: hypothetical protein NTW97_02850 [Candidatus Krumholzibacteria bacterium]|nr:hypothetical protein [Candidatus Krumholzibacteria bacterium]